MRRHHRSRPARAAFPALLLLAVLAGCSDGDADGEADGDTGPSSSTPEPVAGCGGLDVRTATSIVGEAVTLDLSRDMCVVDSVSRGTPVLVIDDLGPDVRLDVEATAPGGAEEDTRTTPVEVPGTTEATVEDTGYVTRMTATTPDTSYLVYSVGHSRAEEVRMNVAGLTAYLGGALAPESRAAPAAVQAPCAVLTADEVAPFLGRQVRALSDPVDPNSTCSYDGDGVSLVLESTTQRLRPDVLAGVQRKGQGAEVEQVTGPGVVDAYLVELRRAEAVMVYAATTSVTLTLTVAAQDQATAERIARQLLVVL